MEKIFAGILRGRWRRPPGPGALLRGPGRRQGAYMGSEFRRVSRLVVFPGEPGITSVAPDMNVFDLVPDRQRVERQGGLDETAMGLSPQGRQVFFDRIKRGGGEPYRDFA